MIEVNCVSKKALPPHPKGYNILFADGHIITSKRLPPSISKLQQAKIKKIQQELELAMTLAAQPHQHIHN